MGRCSIDKLADVKAILAEIRKWPLINEPKPGIFYLKRVPFLHFHEENGRRWADIKHRGEFAEVDLPFNPTGKQIAAFLKVARVRHSEMV